MLGGFFIALLSGRKCLIISVIVFGLPRRFLFGAVWKELFALRPPLNREMVINTTDYTANGWNRHIHSHNMYRNTNRKRYPHRLVKGGDSDDPDDPGFPAENKF
jgi:hypothetical protein